MDIIYDFGILDLQNKTRWEFLYPINIESSIKANWTKPCAACHIFLIICQHVGKSLAYSYLFWIPKTTFPTYKLMSFSFPAMFWVIWLCT